MAWLGLIPASLLVLAVLFAIENEFGVGAAIFVFATTLIVLVGLAIATGTLWTA